MESMTTMAFKITGLLIKVFGAAFLKKMGCGSIINFCSSDILLKLLPIFKKF